MADPLKQGPIADDIVHQAQTESVGGVDALACKEYFKGPACPEDSGKGLAPPGGPESCPGRPRAY